MESIGFYLVSVGIVAFMVRHFFWVRSSARTLLNRWAQENGLEILHSKVVFADLGPFSWSTSKSQLVYFVLVRDREGSKRSAWVRCGRFWQGRKSHTIEIKWKDEYDNVV
jgi:hypothetical protein